MRSDAITPKEYMAKLPADRQEAMEKLRQTILDHLPKGFEEVMNCGMLGYVVPYTIYPNGYHCDPKQPLPFINLGSQKNFIAFYHMGLYGNAKLLEWFVGEYPKHIKSKLDMGKSCVRFKRMDQIPYTLVGELIAKVSMEDWIGNYENALAQMRKPKK
jgi:hypothetical protein